MSEIDSKLRKELLEGLPPTELPQSDYFKLFAAIDIIASNPELAAKWADRRNLARAA